MNLVPVILSGGAGTRLWPLSRSSRPKQFLKIVDDQTLFQATLQRLAGLKKNIEPIVVANHEHRFLVAEQCQSVGVTPSAIIVEPYSRNTAPAVALAAWYQYVTDPDAILLVLPSDQVVSDISAFYGALSLAYNAAQKDLIALFGITPTEPEVGYGYVKSGPADSHGWATVSEFREKPELAVAQQYLREGGYFWNSGIFIFKASTFLDELRRHAPQVYESSQKAMEYAKSDLDFVRADPTHFERCPSDSIDYAIMERTNRAVVVALNAGWSDVGAWNSVWSCRPRDVDGNAVCGDVVLLESTNSYVHAESRLVSLLGVSDLVVVETSDAVLICQKSDAQSVKKIVNLLRSGNRHEADFHREVFRPWGAFDCIGSGERYQVKRLTVTPGGRLSLQKHHHRAEHWVVVKGTARVSIGGVEKFVAENESVFIPLGVKHSLENPGDTPLEIIEVQSGSYLGEDDIVRYEDRYGRV